MTPSPSPEERQNSNYARLFMEHQKILIVDDEKGIRDLFAKTLELEGYSVAIAKDGKDALKKTRAQTFHLILIDLRMPKMDGVNAIMEMKRSNPDAIFIIITGFPLGEEVEKVLRKGGYDCIRKPFNLKEVIRKIKRALEGKPRLEE